MSAHDSIGPQFEIEPLKKSDLGNAPGAATSKQVSPEEYQTMAGRGKQYLDHLAGKQSTRGLDRKWNDVTSSAHQAAQEPWGGATYNVKTGKPLSQGANSYAVSAKEPGQKQVSVKPGASQDELTKAMSQTRDTLPKHATHIGVFHDADKGTIDVDPIVVTKRRADADNVGAYTKATGGAYHFRSGNGYYPPHVGD